MSRDIDIHGHYNLNGNLPVDIPENLKEFLPEDEGLSYEEVILQQASMYESYQECARNRVVGTDDDDDDDHNNDSSCSDDEGESLRNGSANSQEAMDEAYARSLQELGEEFDDFFITEFNRSANGITESSVATLTDQEQVASPEEIDPDNMRYEELLNLTETVGIENIGLSAALISQLPTSIYTSRVFSKNKEENCVICQENFRLGKRLITLPCCHQYHSKCIIEWLKLKKNCPICQKEVVV